MRCTQINRVGEQCRGQAVDGSLLCAFHAGILEGRASGGRAGEMDDEAERPARGKPRFPLIYRLAAALLLLIFAMQFAGTIQDWFR